MLIRFASICFSLIAFSSSAALLSPAVKSDIETEQAKRLQSLEASRQAIEQLQALPLPAPVLPAQDAQCFVIQKLTLRGNQHIATEILLAAIDFRAGDCIGIKAINNMLKIVTNTYIDKAYVTSRAVLLPQNLSNGELVVDVLEGKLESLQENGMPSSGLQHLFPGESGRILNLRDIEQTLDQMNRLSRYNATVQMLPGTRPGFSLVDIQTRAGVWWRGELGYSNSGQDSTGKEQLSVTLVAEDLLGLYESWSLSGAKSAEFVDSRDSQSLQLGWGMPFGYWTLNYQYAYSDYLTTVNSQNFSFESSGKTQRHALDSQWLFHRDSISKSSLRVVIGYDHEKNFIDKTLLNGSSNERASVTLAAEHSTRLAGGFLTMSPLYERGLAIPGYRTVPGSPEEEFNKGTVTVNYTYPLSPDWVFSTTLFTQIAAKSLPGSERLSIGGEYSVRGFQGQSLSGDAGYYWRNDLNYHLGQWPYLGQLDLNVALDTGAIHPDNTDPFERGHLTGGAVGLRAQSGFYQSTVLAGWPIEHPSWMSADDYSLNYRFSLRF